MLAVGNIESALSLAMNSVDLECFLRCFFSVDLGTLEHELCSLDDADAADTADDVEDVEEGSCCEEVEPGGLAEVEGMVGMWRP